MSRTQTFVGLFVILLGLDMLFDINLFRILFPLIIIWFGLPFSLAARIWTFLRLLSLMKIF